MEIKRTLPFSDGVDGQFDDSYKGHESLMQRILNACEVKQVYVPFNLASSGNTVSDDELSDIFTDADVLYLLTGVDVASLSTEYDAKFVYPENDDLYETPNGAIVKNVIISRNVSDAPEVIGACLKGDAISLEEAQAIREEKSRTAIATLVKAGIDAEILRVSGTITTLERQLSEKKRDYVSLANTLERTHRQLISAEQMSKECDTRIEVMQEEISEMLKSDVLKSVLIRDEGNVVVFKTGEISITDINGEVHPIGGEFEVTIVLSNASIHIANNDNYIYNADDGELPHPHVSTSGTPCLGSISTVLPELCASRDIPAMWQIVHSYLTSYNEDDVWGRRLKYWKTDKGEIVPVADESICSCCGRLVDEEDIYTCYICGDVICPECARITDDGDALCSSCSETRYCDVCDEYHTAETFLCDECGNRMCSEAAIGGEHGMYCCDECYFNAEPNEDEDEEDGIDV